jgi:hypothetical protein
MADVIYNAFKKRLLDGNLNFGSDNIYMALVTSGYVPSQDNDDFFNDVTNEVSGTGYTASGMILANKSTSQDNTDNEGVFDADDLTWPSATITARAGVLYKNTGVASTSPLIAYKDFTSDKTSTGGDFVIQFSTEGIINVNDGP